MFPVLKLEARRLLCDTRASASPAITVSHRMFALAGVATAPGVAEAATAYISYALSRPFLGGLPVFLAVQSCQR